MQFSYIFYVPQMGRLQAVRGVCTDERIRLQTECILAVVPRTTSK